ncbi:MAG TPA: HD domain-containing protein [Candidatus Saccharimonadales bacterium]|nr:HD domain-containing protein [Candidatus Saccharimonadales bacterium]
MHEKIGAFKAHVREISANPDFVHHKWFVEWHLELVERIAKELLVHYAEADKELVEVMVWLHDYGKIIDFDHQYDRKLLDIGRDKLLELGFADGFANKAADYIEWMDKKLEVDLRQAPIEIQVVSSADGCSHLVGPFMQLWWYENANKPFDELMADNKRKAQKDWNHKIVLPEARAAFEPRFNHMMEQSGELPEKFL